MKSLVIIIASHLTVAEAVALRRDGYDVPMKPTAKQAAVDAAEFRGWLTDLRRAS